MTNTSSEITAPNAALNAIAAETKALLAKFKIPVMSTEVQVNGEDHKRINAVLRNPVGLTLMQWRALINRRATIRRAALVMYLTLPPNDSETLKNPWVEKKLFGLRKACNKGVSDKWSKNNVTYLCNTYARLLGLSPTPTEVAKYLGIRD